MSLENKLMKIRTDFVTNSSSTSFIIISSGDFSQEKFLELMGINIESPMEPLFTALYYSFKESMHPAPEYFSRYKESQKDWFTLLQEKFSPEIVSRIGEAQEGNKEIYIGELSSDNNFIESFFCTDSFEIANDSTYINALNCGW